jgi:Ser/Thr protein kinase RdoA (MazF antagonist)
MARAVRRPDAHGPDALGPRAGLDGLGLESAKVVRPLGGNANMHWLVEADGQRMVLRRYGQWRSPQEVDYEVDVLKRVAAGGWKVPVATVEPRTLGPHVWCAFEFIPGRQRRPRSDARAREFRRRGGRVLAELHATLETVDIEQRPHWVRRDEVLGPRADGPTLEELLSDRTKVSAAGADFVRPYIDQTHAWFDRHGAERLPVMLNHGDLHGGNVLYVAGAVSGLIDFDYTRVDHRAAEFSYPWRGHYDEFVEGYEEVRELDESDRALLLPSLWATLLDALRLRILGGAMDDGPMAIDQGWWGPWFARRPASARYLPPG